MIFFKFILQNPSPLKYSRKSRFHSLHKMKLLHTISVFLRFIVHLLILKALRNPRETNLFNFITEFSKFFG